MLDNLALSDVFWPHLKPFPRSKIHGNMAAPNVGKPMKMRVIEDDWCPVAVLEPATEKDDNQNLIEVSAEEFTAYAEACQKVQEMSVMFLTRLNQIWLDALR